MLRFKREGADIRRMAPTKLTDGIGAGQVQFVMFSLTGLARPMPKPSKFPTKLTQETNKYNIVTVRKC